MTNFPDNSLCVRACVHTHMRDISGLRVIASLRHTSGVASALCGSFRDRRASRVRTDRESPLVTGLPKGGFTGDSGAQMRGL